MPSLINDFLHRVREASDRVFLYYEDLSFTYREVDATTNRYGAWLQNLKLGDNPRMAVYMQNSPELIFSLLAIWKAGGTCVPVNMMWKAGELTHAVEESEVKVIFCRLEQVAEIEKMIGGSGLRAVIAVDSDVSPRPGDARFLSRTALAGFSPDWPYSEPGETDLAMIMYTGGTTGRSKGALITHGGYYETQGNLARALRGRPGPYPIAKPDKPPNVILLPLFHGGGLQSLLFALHAGRSVALLERFEIHKLAATMIRYRPDNLVLVPTMVHILAVTEEEVDLSSLKTVNCTGGQLTQATKQIFEERYGIPIIQNYGQTEAGHLAGWSIRDIREGKWKPGAVGRVYEGVELKIFDDNDQELPPGQLGEIVCRSGGNMKGYTAGTFEEKVIRNGWLHTQDLGYLDEDRCLFVAGRKRDLIKCGGYQIYPAEVEDCLLTHPAVASVAVVGIPDEMMGEIPKAFVVLREGAQASEEEIIGHGRQNLAHYKAVRQVEFIDELPVNEAGKPLKRLLVERDLKRGSSG